MMKMLDRLLLFIFSLTVLLLSGYALSVGAQWLGQDHVTALIESLYSESLVAYTWVSVCVLLLLISLRFLFVSLRRGRGLASSINQRTEHGDIQISLETVENLALRAANRVRGIKDLKARVKVNNAGLEIVIRIIVDGESPIPTLTEEVQNQVKSLIEEITGIPVAEISVFVANVGQSQVTFKSRVE